MFFNFRVALLHKGKEALMFSPSIVTEGVNLFSVFSRPFLHSHQFVKAVCFEEFLAAHISCILEQKLFKACKDASQKALHLFGILSSKTPRPFSLLFIQALLRDFEIQPYTSWRQKAQALKHPKIQMQRQSFNDFQFQKPIENDFPWGEPMISGWGFPNLPTSVLPKVSQSFRDQSSSGNQGHQGLHLAVGWKNLPGFNAKKAVRNFERFSCPWEALLVKLRFSREEQDGYLPEPSERRRDKTRKVLTKFAKPIHCLNHI